MPTIYSTQSQDLNLEGADLTNIPQNINKTYSTVLKLICGALVRGTKYSDMYVYSKIEDDDMSKTSDNRIDRNCDVLPIEYDLRIVMLVNINITITIIVFFLNQ